jgi:AcrR family transcriptional regulator
MGSITEERSQGRAARTRQRIVATARTAFAAKGYDGTNLVGDVLEPAGVSAGSFYHQFRSKSDLYQAVVQEAAVGWQGPLESLARRRDHGGPESLDDLRSVALESYSGVFEAVDQNEDLVRIQMRDRDHPDPEVCEPLRALRASWIATVAGAYDGLAADPAAAAEVTVALALGAIALYLDTPRAERDRARRRLTENLTAFTLGGLFSLDHHHRSQA